jgi:DNA-binding NarL/FixJ family response regulator
VLADDDVLLREGLASLLERSGMQVIGQAGDARELLEIVGREHPDLAVVDIRSRRRSPPRAWRRPGSSSGISRRRR